MQFGRIGDKNVVITKHALSRFIEMGVDADDIRELILNPDNVYLSKKYPGAYCHQRGSYSIALKQDANTLHIITVLYASLEDWCEAAKDGRLGDRTLRPDTGIPRRRR